MRSHENTPSHLRGPATGNERFLRGARRSAEGGDEHLALGGGEVRPEPDRAGRCKRSHFRRPEGAGANVRGAQPLLARHVPPAALPPGKKRHTTTYYTVSR